MNLLVIDIETTGFDPEVDKLLEVGAAVFNVPTRSILWSSSALIPDTISENPAQHINHITPVMMDEAAAAGWDPIEDVNLAIDLFGVAAVVAHSAGFEREWLSELLPKGTRWICTVQDIRFPRQRCSNKLDHLAVDHGINPVGGRFRHRALMDVFLTCALLAEVDDLEQQIDEAFKPKKLFVAEVEYGEKELAKQAGFMWDKPSKTWRREMPFDTITEPTGDRPFRIHAV